MQIGFYCAHVVPRTSLLEIISVPAVAKLGKSDRAAGSQYVAVYLYSTFISLHYNWLRSGDFSFDPLGLSKSPAKAARYKLSELKNGRLAMMAFSGIVTQAALTGKPFPCT